LNIKFNFNNYIKVKLNDGGLAILFKDYKENADNILELFPDWNFSEYLAREIKYDKENNIIIIQMWKFIDLFGAEFIVGKN
jgi:hypothetical protein